MWNLQKLKAICNILTEETCKTLVMDLVISHVDYANAILVGLPETDIHKLQWVKNMAGKLILNNDSVTECFKKLHWLPIKTRIHFKILTLTYKCLNNQVPEYLCNLLTINETNDRQLRSSSQYRRLIVPFISYRHLLQDLSVLQHQDYGILSPTTLNRAAHWIFFKLALKHFYLKLHISVNFKL